MQETIFYLGLQISKQFELEKEFLTIDNYYECITYLALDYKMQYMDRNMGLLEGINDFINNNLVKIENALVRYNVSETKDWKVK